MSAVIHVVVAGVWLGGVVFTTAVRGKRMVAVQSFLSRICGAGSVAHLFAYLMAFEDSQGKTTSSARSRGST